MSRDSATKFIEQAQIDNGLRKQLNSVKSHEKLKECLEANGYSFTPFEFDDAFNNRLVNCQFQEQADQLNEMKMWWELLHGFLGVQVESTSSACGTCSIKSSCNLGSCSSPK